jgi:DNA glycosylase AlkZ-like
VIVTAEAARRFLVTRHLLSPARSLQGGPDAVLDAFRRLGSIQFDPIAVAGRNHDLVLHARVADYDPAWCDALYQRREIFEVTNKALSFVLTSEFPWFRLGIGRKGSRFHAAILGRTPRSPNACSLGSGRRGRCRRATSSGSTARRRTGSGCPRTSCALS